MSESSSAELLETPPAREAVDTQAIDIVLKSRSFERATASRQLLAYLWTHQKEEFSEYTLAVEALGRRPDFEPKIDATVRVQVSRLRQRLHDFYQSYEATLCPVLLTIPVGTHQLQITHREMPSTAQPVSELAAQAPIPSVPAPQVTKLTYLFAGLALFLFAVICVMAYFQIHGAGARVAEARTPESQFWSIFLGSGKMTRIILPTPIFLRLTMQSNSFASATSVSTTSVTGLNLKR